jgi:sortase A
MKPPIKRRRSLSGRTQSILRWGQSFFFVVGILALGYCAYVLLDARLYQSYQSRQFQQAVNDAKPPVASIELPASSSIFSLPLDSPSAPVNKIAGAARPDFPLGRIEIARIGLEAMIMEGLDGGTLRRAVGHVPGTPLPGQQGNVALAGHRDTFFRPLSNIRNNDEITLTTLNGSYLYIVDSIGVVEPGDVGVLDDSGDAILTLVTCYPFNFVGPASRRFIVRAHRIPA